MKKPKRHPNAIAKKPFDGDKTREKLIELGVEFVETDGGYFLIDGDNEMEVCKLSGVVCVSKRTFDLLNYKKDPVAPKVKKL